MKNDSYAAQASQERRKLPHTLGKRGILRWKDKRWDGKLPHTLGKRGPPHEDHFWWIS